MTNNHAESGENGAAGRIDRIAIDRVTLIKLIRTVEAQELELDFLSLQTLFDKTQLPRSER